MKYFKLEELDATSESQFHPGFLQHLDDLREHLKRSLIITSGARSASHNSEIGGKEKSLHIYDAPQHAGQKGCMAVDIGIPDPGMKMELVKTALLLGWSVGINDKKRFVHVDRRVDIGLPQAVFSY